VQAAVVVLLQAAAFAKPQAWPMALSGKSL
jgi:hypothetical protein